MELLTIEQVAANTCQSAGSIRNAIADGKISAVQKGRGTRRKHLMIPADQIQRLLKESQHETNKAIITRINRESKRKQVSYFS